MTKYLMPANEVLSSDTPANLAHFLIANTGSVCGRAKARMKAADQRKLFGRFLGKGTIIIDGEREELLHYRKVAFGLDSERTDCIKWGAL